MLDWRHCETYLSGFLLMSCTHETYLKFRLSICCHIRLLRWYTAPSTIGPVYFSILLIRLVELKHHFSCQNSSAYAKQTVRSPLSPCFWRLIGKIKNPANRKQGRVSHPALLSHANSPPSFVSCIISHRSRYGHTSSHVMISIVQLSQPRRTAFTPCRIHLPE